MASYANNFLLYRCNTSRILPKPQNKIERVLLIFFLFLRNPLGGKFKIEVFWKVGYYFKRGTENNY